MGEGGIQFHLYARIWVVESEGGSMEEVASEARVALAVGGVADHGMPDSSHVNPDLVGPAGSGGDVEQGEAVKDCNCLVAGLGFPASLDHCHFLASGKVPAHGGLDYAFR